jgi:hypothetical protein
VLTITLELLSIFSKNTLEHSGTSYRVIAVPHLIEKLSVGLDQPTTCPQWVLFVEILLEPLIEEIFGELPCIAQTLKATIHIACVSEVTQSDLAIAGSLTSLEACHSLLQFSISVSAARGGVPPLVLFEAAFRAVFNSLAGTFNL